MTVNHEDTSLWTSGEGLPFRFPRDLEIELNTMQVSLLNVGYTIGVAERIMNAIRYRLIRNAGSFKSDTELVREGRACMVAVLSILGNDPIYGPYYSLKEMEKPEPVKVPPAYDLDRPISGINRRRQPMTDADHARIAAAEAKRARKAATRRATNV